MDRQELNEINLPNIFNCNQYPIIGIDLGVSYWSAAAVENGKVQIIPISGKNFIPAFVACLKDEFKFGYEAKKMFFDNREVTIFDVIYILGLRFNSGGELEAHMNDYSYAISNFGDKPKLSFANKNPDKYIEELFDIIISNLINTSETFLNKIIHNIVVPIPVYFKESQKSALLKATTRVGIIELISEPIAAAYAYRIHEKYKDDPSDSYFLVYNLQEDNLDVSVVQYTNNKFNIKSNIYERHLKRNYTFRFLDELCTQTYETYFISNPRFHPLNSGTLRYYCKTIFEDILHADCFKIEMDTIRDEKIVRTISRAELDELLLVLVQESLVLVKHVLDEAKLQTCDIKEVLFVGQLTRHAIVRQQLKYLFGKISLNCSLNPEGVLVTGAALRADILQRDICEFTVTKPVTSSKAISISTVSVISVNKRTNFNLTNENGTKGFETNEQNNLEFRKNAGSGICFETGDFDNFFLHKKKFKQLLIKQNSIKKRKVKSLLRDKVLSMCTLFTNVVRGSNLKMSLKKKLLFVSSFLCNKLKCRSSFFKKSNYKYNIKENDENDQDSLRVEYKNPTENVSRNHKKNCKKQDKFQETKHQNQVLIKPVEDTRRLNFQKNDLIFEEYNLSISNEVSSKNKKKHINLPKCLNLSKEEKTNWSLKNKVNCIHRHLDMFYVIICLVVFMLHWASENICINIAIALVSIAITLTLNNRASTQNTKIIKT